MFFISFRQLENIFGSSYNLYQPYKDLKCLKYYKRLLYYLFDLGFLDVTFIDIAMSDDNTGLKIIKYI